MDFQIFKAAGKIIVWYISIYKCSDRRGEGTNFWTLSGFFKLGVRYMIRDWALLRGVTGQWYSTWRLQCTASLSTFCYLL